MAGGKGLWVPDGEDYGGLNDRWGVMPRQLGNAYFQRAKRLLDSSTVSELQSEILANRNSSETNALNHERIFLILLQEQG
eukprot:1784950-Amphidinium_carterae.1